MPQVGSVHQGWAGIIARVCREETRTDRSLKESSIPFLQEFQTDERIQQHLGGSRIGMDLFGKLFGGSAAGDGGEYIQFERGENRPAGHETSNHFIEIVGKCANLVSGFQHRPIAVTMLRRLPVHRGYIAPGESRHNLAQP